MAVAAAQSWTRTCPGEHPASHKTVLCGWGPVALWPRETLREHVCPRPPTVLLRLKTKTLWTQPMDLKPLNLFSVYTQEHKVLLTGTPLQNSVEELFSLLNFLEPQQFPSETAFLEEFGDLKTEEQVPRRVTLVTFSTGRWDVVTKPGTRSDICFVESNRTSRTGEAKLWQNPQCCCGEGRPACARQCSAPCPAPVACLGSPAQPLPPSLSLRPTAVQGTEEISKSLHQVPVSASRGEPSSNVPLEVGRWKAALSLHCLSGTGTRSSHRLAAARALSRHVYLRLPAEAHGGHGSGLVIHTPALRKPDPAVVLAVSRAAAPGSL